MKLKTAAMGLLLVANSGALYDFGVDGRRILCVPETEVNSVALRQSDVSTHLIVGQGRTPGVPVLFDAVEVQKRIPVYAINNGFPPSNFLNAISGEVDFLDQRDQSRYGPGMRSAYAKEIWYKRAPCSRPQIAPIRGASLYEVSCSNIDRESLLLNRAPNPQIAMPDENKLVVAACSNEPVAFGPYKGAVAQNCVRSVVVDGFLADYHFQKQNAGIIPRLDSFFNAKITEWKRNCKN